MFFDGERNLSALMLSGDLLRVVGFGFSLGFCIGLQIFVGVLLSWIFFSCYLNSNWFFVLFIMMDFDLGFILRSFHIVLTSLIFFVLYNHLLKCIFLCLLFDSHLIVWAVGFIIYIFIMIVAFIGYLLPCTSMSYWGLTVISNILATVPLIGTWFCYWFWGSEYISDYTLVKLHSIHIFVPFLLLFFVVFHFFTLHFFISSDGLSDRFVFYQERLFFYSYYLLRDLCFLFNILLGLTYAVTINWYFVFHEESWIVVNVLKTSDKILPFLIEQVNTPEKGIFVEGDGRKISEQGMRLRKDWVGQRGPEGDNGEGSRLD